MITQMVSVKSVGHQTNVMNVGEIFIKKKGLTWMGEIQVVVGREKLKIVKE